MRLHRFYIQAQPSKSKFSVTDPALIHQWKNVFRLAPGDRIRIFSGDDKEWVARLTALEKKHAELVVEEEHAALLQSTALRLFPALIKKDNLEWVFQKGTELGVTHFAPILSARSEKKSFNHDRAMKIITEAAEQSGWGMIPTLENVRALVEVVTSEKDLLAFDASGIPFTEKVLERPERGGGILIGPEGGFSPEELLLFREHNIPVYSLGTQTLRAETAAVAALSKILL